MTGACVCICTFRRASVLETLASLMEIRMPDATPFEIIVIDNDEEPSAREAVERFAATAERAVRYVHCPGSNISIARNGALDASNARHMAFIDDDEVASIGWLDHLMTEQEQSGADIVLGPVEARYDMAAPAWMRAARLHSTEPVQINGTIRTGYSGNVLLDRECGALEGLRFDPDFGMTGGEDTVFFGMAHAAGARIAFARDALVTEPVTPARQAFGWMARRKLRMGRTHAWLMLAVDRRNRWRELPIAGAKLACCGLLALAVLPLQRQRNQMVLRLLLHAGVVSGLVAWRGDQPALLLAGRWGAAAE